MYLGYAQLDIIVQIRGSPGFALQRWAQGKGPTAAIAVSAPTIPNLITMECAWICRSALWYVYAYVFEFVRVCMCECVFGMSCYHDTVYSTFNGQNHGRVTIVQRDWHHAGNI